jgi:hypothetical protein
VGAEFAEHYAEQEGLSYDELLSQRGHDYVTSLDFTVSEADYYDDFVLHFGLETEAQQVLDTLGFVVVDSPDSAGPGDVYYDIFSNDLPLYVTADSILHAWHRTYDSLLKETETAVLLPALQALLDQSMAALDSSSEAGRDASIYLAVARALLEPDWPVPASINDEVDSFLGYIEQPSLREVDFLGARTPMDFSQFIPRGHYTDSEELKQYFKAMMWLGRTDLVLLGSPNEGSPRQEAAARALAGVMTDQSIGNHYRTIDDYYAVCVGRTNAVTPIALLELCAEGGLTDCVGDGADMADVYEAQQPPEYSSRVFAGDVPPIAMRFLPQRFGYDSWVTSQTTTPRLKPAVPGGRAMAMVEDVAFVLGNDRALEYMADDMTRPHRENLPATLESLRLTMDAIAPPELEATVYNHWLEALRALSRPQLDEHFPQVMRRAEWHDRKMEAVLGSWTELRHDNILLIEQSSGGIACQYPEGYVEPVPELYRSLAHAAALFQSYYETQGQGVMTNASSFFAHVTQVMEQLALLADKELAGEPMTDGELLFLNETVDRHAQDGYYGTRCFDGWYPRLFWTNDWPIECPTEGGMMRPEDHPSAVFEPLVADVHTDAEAEQALEVAVGDPGLMVVAIDNDGDRSLFAGPVYNFYSFAVPLSSRMTDNEWLQRLQAGDLPERPLFTRSYWR